MNLDPIDELYKNNFESYQAPYSEQAWVQLQKALRPKAPWHLIKNHLFKWYSLVPATAVVSTAVVLAILSFSKEQGAQKTGIAHSISINSSNKVPTDNQQQDHADHNSKLNSITETNAEAGSNKDAQAFAENMSSNKTDKIEKALTSNSLTVEAIHDSKKSSNKAIIATSKAGTNASEANSNGHYNSPIVSATGSGKVESITTGIESTRSDLKAENNVTSTTSAAITGTTDAATTMKSTDAIKFIDLNILSPRNGLLGINTEEKANERSIYKSMPLPGIVNRYDISLSTGLGMINMSNGYTTSSASEQLATFSKLHGHLYYSLGMGRYAFDASKILLTQTNKTVVDSSPFTYYVAIPDTHSYIVYHNGHKIRVLDTFGYKSVPHTIETYTFTNVKTIVTQQIESHLRFIEIPLSMGYRFNKLKAFADVQGGVSMLLNESKSYNYYFADGSTTVVKPYNAFALNGTVRVGYNISEHIGAFCYGRFRYSSTFNALPTGEKLTWTSYSAGLGLSYRF